MPEEFDEFGIPIKNKRQQEVDEFGVPIKKKETGGIGSSVGALFGTGGAGLSASSGIAGKIKSKPTAKPRIEDIETYNQRFRDITGTKSTQFTLGSELPQIKKAREEKDYLQFRQIEDNEINPVLSAVQSGTADPNQLKELYNKPYGKRVVQSAIEEVMPGASQYGLDADVVGSDRNWQEIAAKIQETNRSKGVESSNQQEAALNNELSNDFKTFTYGNERIGIEGKDEAVMKVDKNSFGQIDPNNFADLENARKKVLKADKVWGANGLEADKKSLLKKIEARQFQLKAQEQLPEEIVSNAAMIKDAVSKVPVEWKRKGGNPELVAKDAEYVMDGLNYIRESASGEYKMIMASMAAVGRMSEQQYQDLVMLGRDINYYRKFKSGEYVEQDMRDFMTPQVKKAYLSGWLSQRLKEKRKSINTFKVSDNDILEAYKDAPEELKDDELLYELRRQEAVGSGGKGIRKTGGIYEFYHGIASPLKSVANTFDIAFDSPFEAYLKSKELDRGDQKIPQKGGGFGEDLPSNTWLNKAVGGFGSFLTQVMLARGIGAGTSSVGNTMLSMAAPRAATLTTGGMALKVGTPLSTLAQTYGDEFIDFLEKTGSPAKAGFGAFTSGLAQGYIERFVMPDVKIADNIGLLTSKRNFARDIINVVEKGGGKAEIGKVVRDFVYNTTKTLGKEAILEENLQNLTNALTEQIISPKTAADRDLMQEIADVSSQSITAMAIPSLLGGAGETKVQRGLNKAQLHHIGVNYKTYQEALDRQLARGLMSKQDYEQASAIIQSHGENVKNAPVRDANGELISAARQLEYAYQSTVAEVAAQQAAKQPDKIQREPLEKKVEEADKIKRQIFYGENDAKLPPKKDEPIVIDQDRDLMDEGEITPESAIQNAIESGQLKGGNLMSAQAALGMEGGAQMFLQEVADQALNKQGEPATDAENMKRARETYGDELVDMAIAQYPKEVAAKESGISVQMPQEVSKPQTTEIKPAETTALKDVESTAKALETESKNKPTIWEQVKNAAKNIVEGIKNIGKSEYEKRRKLVDDIEFNDYPSDKEGEIILKKDGKNIGSMDLHYGADGLLHIKWVKINKEFQGKGLSLLLYGKATEIAAQKGLKGVGTGFVTHSTTKTQGIYKHFNFTELGESKGSMEEGVKGRKVILHSLKDGNENNSISEAYHADKAAGKETDLTKAVESLLSKEQPKPAETTTPTAPQAEPAKTTVSETKVSIGDVREVGGYVFEKVAEKSFKEENVFFRIKDNNGEIIGKIYILNNGDFYKIENVELKKERIGIGYNLYSNLISLLDKPIISGTIQNEKAIGLWDKLVANGLAKKVGKGYVSITPKTTVSDAEALPVAAGQAETKVANSAKQLADKVRSLKINLSKLGDGGLQSNPLGLPVAVWNGAMDIVAKTIEAGGQVADAVKRGLNYIQKNHRGQWDKKGFNDQVLKELGVRGITVNGQDLIVKDVEPEFAETINGFYSDIEQSILEVSPTDKGTPQAWQKKIGTGEEAKWTGITDWLNSLPKDQKLSRQEILQWLKDNRIQVVEVVKGGVRDIGDSPEEMFESGELILYKRRNESLWFGFPFSVQTKDGKPVKLVKSYEDAIIDQDVIDEAKKISNRIKNTPATKFSQYQLEGQKTNYKEVLVTLPSVDRSVPKMVDAGNGKYYLEFDNGNRLFGTYTKSEAESVIAKRKSQGQKSSEVKFKSSHFDEPNILVHIRMNTRTDADGKKVLFLEEIQSDWGQKGKKEGFIGDYNIRLDPKYDMYVAYDKNGDKIPLWYKGESVQALDSKEKVIAALKESPSSAKTPQAPFVTETPSWTKLGLKVALKEAVKQGADKIAWSTGTQQFDRWGSEEIHWKKREQPNTKWFINKNDAHPRPYEVHYKDKMGTGMVERYSTYEQAKNGLSEYENRWVISVNEQKDGAQAFAGNEEALRNSRLSEADLVITNKEELRNAIKRNLARERNDAEIDKLTNRVWDRMQKEESGTSLPRKEGMEAFYGSPSEGKLGIVGEVAKSLFKQEPKVTVLNDAELFSVKKNPSGGYDVISNKNGFQSNEPTEVAAKEYASKMDGKFGEKAQVQHSIDITPELKAEAESGLPLFKDIKGRGKAIADALRKGKIKMGGLQSNIAGIPAALWNAAIDTIALAIEGGATLAQAVQKAIKKHNLDKQKGFNQKEFISKLEQASGEKLVEEVPPGEPPPPPKAAEKESGGSKDKGILNRLYGAKNVPQAAKEGFEREGLEYQTSNQEEAAAVAKAIIESEGMDEAVRLASEQKFDGDVNSLIFAESLNQLAIQEEKAATAAEKIAKAERFAEIAILYDKMARTAGRFNAAINYFYKKSPLGMILKENADRKDEFNKWAKPKEKSWKESFAELLKDPDFEAVVKEYTREELKKERAASRAARKEKVHKAIDEAAEKWALKLSAKLPEGTRRQGIDGAKVLKAVAASMKAAYNAGESVAKIVQDAIDYISEKLGTTDWGSEEFRKEWEAKLAEAPSKKVLTDEELRQKALDKFRKKLKGLTEEQKDEVIRKSYQELFKNRALDYEDFRKIIANATGRGDLTEEQKNQLKKLIHDTNVVDDFGKRYREQKTQKSRDAYKKAQERAALAARDLADMFDKKQDILRLLVTAMQGSTISLTNALLLNPAFNVINQWAIRLPNAIIQTVIDLGLRMFNKDYRGTYSTVFNQRSFFKQLGIGTSEAVKQIATGLNRQDYNAKEIYPNQIRPMKALRSLRTDKLTFRQKVHRVLQIFPGTPAEIIFRVLNLGDKPMRFGAEGAQASAFAKSLGIKPTNIDFDIFMEFPREEAYRILRERGLSEKEAGDKADAIRDAIVQEGKRSTFQQDNIFVDAINKGFGETGIGMLGKATLISPYIKIPSNAFWSFFNIVHPTIALTQATGHMIAAKNAKAKGDDVKAMKQAREARYWLSHAAVGVGWNAAIIPLVKLGIIAAGYSDDESKKEREGEMTYEPQGTFNVTKFFAFLRGENPDDVKESFTVNLKWFGSLGMFMNAKARDWEEMDEEQRENRDLLTTNLLSLWDTDDLSEMQNSVFGNASSAFGALGEGGFAANKYFLNQINMVANLMQPATIAQINRAQMPYYTQGKSDSFAKELDNAFAQRSWLYRKLTGSYPPAKINIWGEPLKKDGSVWNRVLGFNRVTKDNFAQPLYEDAKKYNDPGFFPAAVTNKLEGQTLTAEQETKRKEFVGAARKALIAPFINDGAAFPIVGKKYSELTPEQKKAAIEYFAAVGREQGDAQLFLIYPELKPKTKTIQEEVSDDLFKAALELMKMKSQ